MRSDTPEPRPPSRREDDDPRFALLVARIAERLRPVCLHWDERSFNSLVRQIAILKVRWGDAYRGDPSELE